MASLTRVRIAGVLAALWNAVGVFSYLGHVGLISGGEPPPGAPTMPPAVTAAFAIGVFAGLAGSVGLALLARWARPMLWVSFIGTLIDWIWVFGWSGSASIPLGVTVLLISAGLVILAEWLARRQALR